MSADDVFLHVNLDVDGYYRHISDAMALADALTSDADHEDDD